MMDKAFTSIEFFDLGLVDIQPENVISFSAELQAQRESHVA
jgi:hypothetical protein